MTPTRAICRPNGNIWFFHPWVVVAETTLKKLRFAESLISKREFEKNRKFDGFEKNRKFGTPENVKFTKLGISKMGQI